MIHLDTHVAVWLYAGLTERLSERAREVIDGDSLRVSPLVGLELQYLHEIGRLTVTANELLADLRARIGLELAQGELASVVACAQDQSWTRDPFDRLLVGQALAENVSLLTADATIRDHFERAVW